MNSGTSQINANPFVETTLAYALTYIIAAAHLKPSHAFAPARLTVLADNDYYSQPHSATSTPSSPPSSSSHHRFAKFPTKLKDAHKTGLGSSAALVTALTAALLTHYLPRAAFDLATDAGRRVLHDLAQAAHCAAQGKVGSGFDVAAAVYGSCAYRRFSPSVLAGLPEAGAPGFAPALAGCVGSDAWDTEVVKVTKTAAGATTEVRMPPGVALRMCDVDCGSQTVGMVKQVLKWREADAAASRALWDELQARNEALGAVLSSSSGDRKTEIAPAVAAVRELVRRMGAASGVPIEPESQAALLDALRDNVEGVHEGVVPGAGGFDALALLVRDDEATEVRIKEFLARWSREKGGSVRLLDVKGETEGVRREGLEQYEGWIA